MTTTLAMRMAGVAAMVSGLLFGVIQYLHPADELASVATDQWLVVHSLTMVFAALGLLGLVGLFVRQAQQAGWWGFAGFLTLFSAFTLMLCFAFYEAMVAPVLAESAPEIAADVLSVLDGEPGPGNLGAVYAATGIVYLVGGLTFSITTLVVKVFPRWAAGLMVLGLLLTLASSGVDALARPSAVVFGLGFAALGLSLVREPKPV